MLALVDGIARLWRYKIVYTETHEVPEGVEAVTEELGQYAISDSEEDALLTMLGDKVTEVTPIDQTGNEWIDGLAFDSRDEAMAALETGSVPVSETDTLMLAITELYEMMIGG